MVEHNEGTQTARWDVSVNADDGVADHVSFEAVLGAATVTYALDGTKGRRRLPRSIKITLEDASKKAVSATCPKELSGPAQDGISRRRTYGTTRDEEPRPPEFLDRSHR